MVAVPSCKSNVKNGSLAPINLLKQSRTTDLETQTPQISPISSFVMSRISRRVANDTDADDDAAGAGDDDADDDDATTRIICFDEPINDTYFDIEHQ